MKLFESARIGTMELRNRIVMPPMGTHFGNADGTVSSKLCTYYASRAAGGAGLITIEITAVDPLGSLSPKQPGIYDDSFIPGLRQLTESIHAGGAKAAVQLHHGGRRVRAQVIGTAAVAPSAIPCPVLKEMPRELTQAEIEALVESFAAGARRAKESGFDAVEVHGTHGYLVAQFLSPWSNKRTDEYGGDVNGRARFALEIVRRIREKVGPDYPIIFRMSGTEFLDDGLNLEEAKQIAVMLEQAGVDALHVSAGTSASREQTTPPVLIPKGHLVPYAAAIKGVVTVPVIAVAGINNLALATSILREDKADFVALGRALIADPDLPNKWREGREREITMCIACNTCMDSLFSGKGIRCVMNPGLGREKSEETRPAQPKRILVCGSGPGSLECARVARLRGHEVWLATEQRKIEGRWTWLISPFVYDKTKALRAAGVDITFGRQLDAGLLDELKPDTIVLEEQLSPVIPDLPGVAKSHVTTADRILGGEAAFTSDQAVVVVGAGNMGCEVTEHLLRRGVKPVVVDSGLHLGDGFEVFTRDILSRKLVEEGATILEQAQVTAIDDKSVRVVVWGGEERDLPADLVVVALGYQPIPSVPPAAASSGLPIHSLKACQSPREACDRIDQGAGLAREL